MASEMVLALLKTLRVTPTMANSRVTRCTVKATFSTNLVIHTMETGSKVLKMAQELRKLPMVMSMKVNFLMI